MVHERLITATNLERMKSAKGKAQFIKFAEGKQISPTEAIRAKCYDCQAYYEDSGNRDCGIHDCPLYPFNPYASDKSQNKPHMAMRERIAAGGMPSGFGFTKKSVVEEAEEAEEAENEDDSENSENT